MRGKPGQESLGWTVGQDILERTAGTGLSGQVSLDRTGRIGLLGHEQETGTGKT
jgi:hypothetical protein